MSKQGVGVLALWSLVVSVLRAQDFHEFAPMGLLPELQADVRAVVAGDLDGDGDVDLVFGCFGVPGVAERNYWLRNDGTGLFSVTGPGWVALAPSLTRAVALGDFDRDGDLDALFGNQRLDSSCRNDGTGRLSLSPRDLPPVDRETNALAVGDVDGDGDLDVVAACNGFNVLYRNDGTGVFSDASSSLPQVWQDCTDAELADFDGDGDFDLLLGGAPASLLWNDGLGHFVAAPLALPSGLAVTTGDIDGDGDRDFVLSSVYVGPYGPPHVRVYRNTGNGNFTWDQLGGEARYASKLIDLDGDTDLDLAVAGRGVFWNDGTGTFVNLVGETRIASRFLTDLDGDGDPDLVVGTRAFRNLGAGNFSFPSGDLELASGPVQELVDFDRDGDLDAVVGGGSQLQVLANDGRGRFATILVQRPLSGWGFDTLAAADWTGDGYPDVLDLASAQLLINQAGQGLTAQPLPIVSANGFVTADFDHDGDLDLAISASNGSFVLRNGGTGSFTIGTGLPVGFYATFDAAADFDADGHVDLLLHLSGQPQVWRGNGTGGFVVMSASLPAGLTGVQCGLARDFDGDGDVDIALGHGYQAPPGPRLTLLANDGAGQFSVAAHPPTTASRVTALAAADIDEDGDLDLAVTPHIYGGEVTRLLRNEGAMAFTDVTHVGVAWRGFPATAGSMVLFGDVDGDADVDAVSTSTYGSKLLRNLRRQTRTWPEPVPGANWRIDVHVRPVDGAVVGVIAGLRELAPGLPTPFGVLRIDLSAAQGYGFFAAGLEPAAGVTLPIPPAPALRGVRLFAQGITFADGDLRLGNQTMDVVR